MYNIAIIGAGQIGSRHLQGIAKVGLGKSIYVVDPSEISLSIAKERCDEVLTDVSATEVQYITSMSLLPVDIDYAVVSTSSDSRFRALTSLVGACRVKNVVLEKVLYTRYHDYENANRLLKLHNINAWVTCSSVLINALKGFSTPTSKCAIRPPNTRIHAALPSHVVTQPTY